MVAIGFHLDPEWRRRDTVCNIALSDIGRCKQTEEEPEKLRVQLIRAGMIRDNAPKQDAQRQ